MGIYYNHGVVYEVVLLDGKRITLIDTCRSDGRLVDTSFFKRRESTWFTDRTPFLKKLSKEDSAELLLTEEEYDRLQAALAVHGENVAEHGWYETNSFTDSYG